jgi:hypothetical protein
MKGRNDMHSTQILAAAGLAVLLGACGTQTDFAGGTPDVDGLTLELAGGTDEGLATAGSSQDALLAAPDLGPDDLALARARILALNTYVRWVVEPIALLTTLQADEPARSVRIYGPAPWPAAAPVANFRLIVKKLADDRFGWRLDAQPLAGGDFLPVLAGALKRGYAPHRGSGFLGVNLENLRAVNPAAWPGSGYLVAAFAHAPGGAKTLVYALVNFDPSGSAAPANAVYAGHRTALGVRHVRVMAVSDRVITTADPELVLALAGWVPGIGGRGFISVSGWTDDTGTYHGDVAQGSYWLSATCWGPFGGLLYKDWRYCTAVDPATCLLQPADMIEVNVASCLPGTELAPPVDATQTTGPTDGAPVAPPALPATVPTDIPAS